MTLKQKKFCDHYIKTGNGTESARVAGYKGNNLRKIASRLLTNVDIKEYIDKKLTKLKLKEEIADNDEILKIATEAMRGEMIEECVSFGEIVTKKISPRDRLKAIEILAKIYKMFDKNENTNISGVVIKDDIK